VYRRRGARSLDDRRKFLAGNDRGRTKNRSSSSEAVTKSKKDAKINRTDNSNVPQVYPEKKADTAVGSNEVKRNRSPVHLLFDESLVMAKSKEYANALVMLDRILEKDRTFVKAYMLKASILVNMNQLSGAEEVCFQVMELDQWCLEVYLLLGLIAKRRNNEKDALKRFREALYVQSSCWLAHFSLAEIYSSLGELEKACREYEIVVNVLKKGKMSDHGLTFFPLSFPVEQIAHLCKHNLAELRMRMK
jgi:chemotaxis protein methyltransferase CheR